MIRQWFTKVFTVLGLAFMASAVSAADMAPDAFVKKLSDDVLQAIKSDKSLKSGDLNKVVAMVDQYIMPNVNARSMTASAVGPQWRSATPEQKVQLEQEFKILLVRIYSGALAQVSDQTISLLPFRGNADDKLVEVHTEIRGSGEPIKLSYRLQKTPGDGAGWKVVNLNVMGAWLMETFRQQFAQQINKDGLDGLIASLKARNKTNANKS